MQEPATSSDTRVSAALVWDAHAGVFPSPDVDLSLLEEWRSHGVDYVSINVGFDVMDWQQTLATLAAYRRWLLARADRFALVEGVDDIETARRSGRLAVSFDIEGMNALNGNLHMVGVYHALGVRQMLFAYNLNNDAGGGCHDEDIGLTEFGRAIVQEMNRVGMLVDCSHASYRTTMDIMAETRAPVVFSHSNPKSVWNHDRNITDDQISACAASGGVIGLNGMGIFLGDNDIAPDTLLSHLAYLCERAGPAHVGLGFDYSPALEINVGEILRSRPDFWPAGQQYDTPHIEHAGPMHIEGISEGLSGMGLSNTEIRGILGENFRRVAEAAWVGAA